MISVVLLGGAMDMTTVPAITTSPMDITLQAPATPKEGEDGPDFGLVLLGHVMAWIGAPECIDLGFATRNSGKELDEDSVARPAVVSHCSAPKRPSGRACLFPKGGGGDAAPDFSEVGSRPVVSAVVEGEIPVVSDSDEKGPNASERDRSALLSPDAGKTQDGEKLPAISQVSLPPVSPVEGVEATSFPSPQVSSVETAHVTSSPSPPLASPDSAWFAPTLQSESGSLLPPLARVGGHVATATPPARAPNSAKTKSDGPFALGSPGEGRAPAPMEPEPPQMIAIPGPSTGETGGARRAGVPASATAEEPARSPVPAPHVVVRDVPRSAQREVRTVERAMPAARDVTVVSAAVFDRTLSHTPAAAAERTFSETPKTLANPPPQAPPAPTGNLPASRPEQPAAVDPVDLEVSPRVGGDGRTEAVAAPLRVAAARPGGAEQDGDGPRLGLADRPVGAERARAAGGEFGALRGAEGDFGKGRVEERSEADLGLREPISESVAGLMGVEKRHEGPAKGLARNEARPLSAQAREVLGQVARAAESAVRFSRVTVELRPPELGTIQIAVESREGNLSAHFQASQPAVRAWLESNAVMLRSELSESGLPFQNMSFSTAGQEQGGRWTGERQEAPQGETPFGPGAEAGLEKGEPAAGTHKGVAEWRA